MARTHCIRRSRPVQGAADRRPGDGRVRDDRRGGRMTGVATDDVRLLLKMRLDELHSSLSEVRASTSPKLREGFESLRHRSDDWEHLDLQLGQEVKLLQR